MLPWQPQQPQFLILSRWRAKVILLRIPVRDRPEVQLKAIAFGALDNRRRNWGYNRKWLGNYLMQQVREEERWNRGGGGRGDKEGGREEERGGGGGRRRDGLEQRRSG